MKNYVPTYQYYLGAYVLPVIGMILFVASGGILFYTSYYFFIENNDLYLMNKLEKEVHKLKQKDWYTYSWYKDLEVHFWDRNNEISIHNKNGCLVSGFAPSGNIRRKHLLLYSVLKSKSVIEPFEWMKKTAD